MNPTRNALLVGVESMRFPKDLPALQGFEVQSCEMDAAGALLAGSTGLDLIVIGWSAEQADIDGLCRNIRGQPWGETAAIVLVANDIDSDRVSSVFDWGVDEVAFFPFDSNEVSRRLPMRRNRSSVTP